LKTPRQVCFLPGHQNRGWDQLEVIEETLFPEGYQENKEQLELIGQEVTEQLDYIQARLIKRRFIRPKFRRKDDRTQSPLVAAAPASPFPGGVPTFSLTAQLIISKTEIIFHSIGNKTSSNVSAYTPRVTP
jgi:hypothetical protein